MLLEHTLVDTFKSCLFLRLLLVLLVLPLLPMNIFVLPRDLLTFKGKESKIETQEVTQFPPSFFVETFSVHFLTWWRRRRRGN